MLEESEEEVYHARQPRMKISVERDGALDDCCSHDLLRECDCVPSVSFEEEAKSDRFRVNKRERSKLRFGLPVDEECHDDKDVGSVDAEEEEEENCDTASMARDRTLDRAAFIVVVVLVGTCRCHG